MLHIAAMTLVIFFKTIQYFGDVDYHYYCLVCDPGPPNESEVANDIS